MLLSNLLMIVAATLSVAAEKDVPAGLVDARQSVIRPVEVRTRRLHVVRPDLIRFPIVYDTVC